jgi:tRNA(fMet)-specific endonuclease VapC
MPYLLDTNACVRYLNGRSEALRRRLDGAKAREIFICSIVKAELFFGAAKSTDPEKALALQKKFVDRFASLPFDDEAAVAYARLRAFLERAGTPIGANDLLIAAMAVAKGLTLVTHNVDEFLRVPDLQVEDWEAVP